MADPPRNLAFDVGSLARAVNGAIVREGLLPIRRAAVDSRRVEPGNAFFALPGERTDGHRFLVDAAQRGAAALVVTSDVELDGLGGASVIKVGDGLIALQQASAEWRNRFDPLVVAVTGSIAKTSTKEQVAEVLSESWNVLRNDANENNEIGLPLTMLRLAPEHEAAVFEMGMYTPGDISVLAALARPSIGVVTAVRGTHLSRAGSIDEIERGKRELVEALPPGGTAVLNADDPRVARMAGAVPANVSVITYGFDRAADVTATEVESLGFDGMRFRLRAEGDEVEVTTPALGRHSVHNGLAAAAVGLAAGMQLETIARGLARPWNAPHRTTIVDFGPIKVLDDSYNASPDSMIAALDLLASFETADRRVAIIGEMLELGDVAGGEHRRIERYARQSADLVMAVGPYEIAEDREYLLSEIGQRLRPGDVVLIKGSRGAAMEEFLPVLEGAAQR
ncbi:MAG: UDP-N-acetylmuramoyl-tripeptide--D-alanyl-D-alanine ligase, partial [Candidatus Limnocylindrales bacterium]